MLRELYPSVLTKRELAKTAKLPVFKSVFVPILIFDHESWVMTERMLFQVQAAEMGFLRRVYDVTLRNKVRSCEIRKALKIESLLRIERSQIRWFGHEFTVSQDRLAMQALLATSTGDAVVQGPGGVITVHLRPYLFPYWCGASRKM